MKRIFLCFVMVFILGCTKTNNNDQQPQAENPSPAFAENSGNGSGTIVGNGGDQTALRFTLFGLKGFEYWQRIMNLEHMKHTNCADKLKETADQNDPWSEEEWLDLLLKKCGNSPLPTIPYFDAINDNLKMTKIFLSETIDCDPAQRCGMSWKSFPGEQKIYISASKWNLLNDQQKIQESMFAYDSLVSKSQRSLITTKLVFEIFSRVFEVDFSIDTFRNFIDARSIRTIDDGSQVYTQEKIVEQMSLAIDCIQLVEKRFPGQLGLTEISLIEGASSIWGNQIRYSYSRPEFDAIVISVFHSFSKYPFDEVALNMRRLILGRNSNLQKCYNSMVSQGLKNPLIELDYRDFVNLTEVPLKPPMSGDSELTLEFINIAFKSLDYVLRDQSKAWLNYKKCQNQNAPQVNCAKPIVFENMIQNMSRDFSLIQVRETDARLCTTDAPQCAKEESLTAINIPDEKLIIISKEKWRASDVNTKIKLALHEVFGIFGLEVNDYHTSAHFAPLVYIEEFNIEFLADEFRQFLIKKNLFPLYVGDFYDHLQFQNRAILLMDCINLVEERFPGRLNIGVVSLRSEHSWSGLMIESNLIFRVLNLYSRFSRLSPKFSHLENLGTEGLYIDENTTLQQCYNKVVALGLK